ncbi:MAG TPA: hypothetical protein VIF62_16440 [Labilithrix sp.]|jgi:hypothetical protein
MKFVRILAIGALVVPITGLALGCYVEPEPTYVTSADYDGYVPAYYDGYLVYYDDTGRPYYYGSNGVAIWVEPSSPHYWGLVQHWRAYGHAYPRWYAHYGYAHRGYRGAPGYHAYGGYRGYHGGARAPAAHRR